MESKLSVTSLLSKTQPHPLIKIRPKLGHKKNSKKICILSDELLVANTTEGNARLGLQKWLSVLKKSGYKVTSVGGINNNPKIRGRIATPFKLDFEYSLEDIIKKFERHLERKRLKNMILEILSDIQERQTDKIKCDRQTQTPDDSETQIDTFNDRMPLSPSLIKSKRRRHTIPDEEIQHRCIEFENNLKTYSVCVPNYWEHIKEIPNRESVVQKQPIQEESDDAAYNVKQNVNQLDKNNIESSESDIIYPSQPLISVERKHQRRLRHQRA